MWLIDAYSTRDKIILWVYDGRNRKVEVRCDARIYSAPEGKRTLRQFDIPYHPVLRKNMFGRYQKVLEIPLQKRFNRFVSWLEKSTRHRVALFDADISPEMQFLYNNNLLPCGRVTRDLRPVMSDEDPPLRIAEIGLKGRKVALDGRIYNLEDFVDVWKEMDPDILSMENAFIHLPELDARIRKRGLEPGFHRWDPFPLRYAGGRPFFSYGRVHYRHFAIRLRGRLLVDTCSAVGGMADPHAIMEFCRISGNRFQQIASRSAGAIFQSALMRTMYRDNILVPYKEKPIDQPLSMFTLLKADRAGRTLDALVGFHKDVGEIDFSSMFPWIMYHKNISAEKLLIEDENMESAPGIPVSVSQEEKGLVPRTIKEFLDRRMAYKESPTKINKARAKGLKAILVSSYGYLRFREFKLGLGSSHMAMSAHARELLIRSQHHVENKGFRVIHGIVDSLYIQKKGISMDEVKQICDDLEKTSSIPVESEGIFKWIVFLPSINNPARPQPARYFGVFRDGRIKARGIEVRQKSAPLLVRVFQQNVLEMMAEGDTEEEIREMVPLFGKMLRSNIRRIRHVDPELLTINVRISKTDYKHDIAQRQVIKKLNRKIHAGERIRYVHSVEGGTPIECYTGDPDVEFYGKRLIRALFVLLQAFGFTQDYVEELARSERQVKLVSFLGKPLITRTVS